jgi:hypothetical protein
MGYLRRGKGIRDERFVRSVSGKVQERECVKYRVPSMFRLIRRAGGLGEDVDNLRFELGVENGSSPLFKV